MGPNAWSPLFLPPPLCPPDPGPPLSSQLLPLPPLFPGSYLMVNASQHAPGQRAHVIFQSLSENDTHCVQFSYFLYSRDGHSPGTLGIYVRVNGGPLGSAVWNMTGSHGRQWHQAELAVSTFWPNEYQVGWVQSAVSLCLGVWVEGCQHEIRVSKWPRLELVCVSIRSQSVVSIGFFSDGSVWFSVRDCY